MPQRFNAIYYPQSSAQRRRVRVTVSEQGEFQFQLDEKPFQFGFELLEISARLGNTPRFIQLPDGSKLETADNALLDQLLIRHRPAARYQDFLHRLELNIALILALIVVVALSVTMSYRYGIPALARVASPMVPDAVRSIASHKTLKQMDGWLLEATELSAEQQARYRALLAEHIAPSLNQPLTLEFRYSDNMGANAFALPDGTLVFTDQILALIDDDEFLAIVAHEAGHVVGDHGMRSVISSTSLMLIFTLLTGDSAAISELLITAPTLLLQLSYSRALETEADDYALALLTQLEIPAEAFASGLEKIVDASDMDDEVDDWKGYLSSHPLPQQRIERFRLAN